MEQLIKETQTYYDRVRNTYHYVINSRKGDAGANNLSNFEMDIPAFPFPEHQGSQIGILKVNSFFICNNDKTDRLPEPQGGGAEKVGDVSGFYVILSGIGLRGQVYSNAKSNPVHGGGVGNAAVPSALFQMNSFWIPNTHGKRNIEETSGQFNVLSGGYSGKEVICGNPAGNKLRVQVIDADRGETVHENLDLYAVLDFSIEVVPTEISNGR